LTSFIIKTRDASGYVRFVLYVHKRLIQKKSKDVTLLLVTHIDLKIKTSDISSIERCIMQIRLNNSTA